MPTITVKNIPPEIYERLKQSARRNHRSINSEIIYCLERAIYSQQINPEAILAKAQQLRSKTASHPTDDEEFKRAKNSNRL